jgi:exopolysaccharide biosynthesis polyprenyl glycosylphosphotransferase
VSPEAEPRERLGGTGLTAAGVEEQRERASTKTRPLRLGRLRAQRLFDLYALQIAPAGAAGLVGLGHLGDTLLAGALFVAVLVWAAIVDRSTFPVELMPIARLSLRALAPVLGAATVVPVAIYGGNEVSIGALTAPVIACWLTMALGAWAKVRFTAGTEVRVAVIGAPRLAASLAVELKQAGIDGYAVVGTVRLPGDGPRSASGPDHRARSLVPELGVLDDAREVVLEHSIDLLVHALDPVPADAAHAPRTSRLDVFETVAGQCLDLPVRMIEASQLYERLLGHVPIGTINPAWFQYLMHPDYHPTDSRAKRLGDLVLGATALLVAAPLIAIAAAAIKLEDRGPVLHRQRRTGAHGGTFAMLKLRTMRADAEAQSDAQWSDADDSRVTTVGRWLRLSHIDELPQLWQVLRGEMTLVGPRPERPEMVATLEQRFPYYERRHLVKPGITGWAQVRCGYAGSDLGSAWKLCHDLYYLKHRSLFGDLLVMLETLGAVGHGAQYGQEAPDPRFIVGEAPAG